MIRTYQLLPFDDLGHQNPPKSTKRFKKTKALEAKDFGSFKL